MYIKLVGLACCAFAVLLLIQYFASNSAQKI